MAAKIAALILNWNGYKDTSECIVSLLKSKTDHCEIVILDNGSTDGSVEKIGHDFPKITIIENAGNIGYAAGNNVGLRYAANSDCRYALVLNNDTIIDPEAINCLSTYMDSHPEVAAAGPVTYFASQADRIQTAGLRVQKLGMRVWQIDQPQSDAPYQVEAINGVALMVRVEALRKIGLMDETFFMYNEELEWCLRFREAGYWLAIVPEAKIWHKINPVARDESAFVLYHMYRGKILLLRRHGSFVDIVAAWLIGLYKSICLLPPMASLNSRSCSLSIINGLWHGLVDRGKPVPRLEPAP